MNDHFTKTIITVLVVVAVPFTCSSSLDRFDSHGLLLSDSAACQSWLFVLYCELLLRSLSLSFLCIDMTSPSRSMNGWILHPKQKQSCMEMSDPT